jgi:hypothetical protein
VPFQSNQNNLIDFFSQTAEGCWVEEMVKVQKGEQLP